MNFHYLYHFNHCVSLLNYWLTNALVWFLPFVLAHAISSISFWILWSVMVWCLLSQSLVTNLFSSCWNKVLKQPSSMAFHPPTSHRLCRSLQILLGLLASSLSPVFLASKLIPTIPVNLKILWISRRKRKVYATRLLLEYIVYIVYEFE